MLPDGLSKISAALSKSGRSPSLKKFATDIEEYKRPGGHYSIGVLEFILRALNIPHERVDLERVEGKILAIHNEEAAVAAAASAAIHNEEAVVPVADDDELAGLSYGDLLAKARALAAEVRDKNARLNDLMQKRIAGRRLKVKRTAYWKNKAESLEKKLREVKRKTTFKKGKGSFFLSRRGGMSLALRRALSKGGAHAITLALQIDVHRTTICRKEIECRAALVACNRAWHKDMRAILANNCHTISDDEGQGGHTKWLFSLHCLRSDATNSSVWRKCKLHTTELDSCYQTTCFTSSTTAEEAVNTIQRKKLFGDLQVMRDCSSAGNYSMMRKQIASIGGPTWGHLKLGPLRLPLESCGAAPTYAVVPAEVPSEVPAGHSSASSGAVVPLEVPSSGDRLHQQGSIFDNYHIGDNNENNDGENHDSKGNDNAEESDSDSGSGRCDTSANDSANYGEGDNNVSDSGSGSASDCDRESDNRNRNDHDNHNVNKLKQAWLCPCGTQGASEVVKAGKGYRIGCNSVGYMHRQRARSYWMPAYASQSNWTQPYLLGVRHELLPPPVPTYHKGRVIHA